MSDLDLDEIIELYLIYKYLKIRKKQCQVCEIFKYREKYGHFHCLVPQMRLNDHDSFLNFFV